MVKNFFMMRSIAALLVIFLFYTACKKSSSDSSTTVEYQVTTTNSSSIAIKYMNPAGDTTLVNAQTSFILDINPQKPFNSYIQASSSSPFSSITTTCTVNILVNGNIVKTATVSSNTIAVAEADYKVQ
jgi:hypothetical protein